MSIQIVMMLPRESASVSMARHTLSEALALAHVTPDCIYEAQVALAEACTNVLHHMSPGQNLELLINIGDLELTIHILDSGPEYPGGHHLGNWPDFTAEHEHGSPALMTAFTEDAVFESQEGSGSVRLKKRLSRLPDDLQAPANLLG
jgi:serine/threonine-protein kinase RsbW